MRQSAFVLNLIYERQLWVRFGFLCWAFHSLSICCRSFRNILIEIPDSEIMLSRKYQLFDLFYISFFFLFRVPAIIGECNGVIYFSMKLNFSKMVIIFAFQIEFSLDFDIQLKCSDQMSILSFKLERPLLANSIAWLQNGSKEKNGG